MAITSNSQQMLEHCNIPQRLVSRYKSKAQPYREADTPAEPPKEDPIAQTGLPAELASPQAMAIWRRAQAAGIVGDHFEFQGKNKTELFGEIRWTPFQQWNPYKYYSKAYGESANRKRESDSVTLQAILKLFRYAKLSENAGYGIDKIYSWERLTGEKVEFATDVMSSTVTYWRPKVGSTVKRAEVSSETTPKTTPKKRVERGADLRQKMIRIMKATPTISRVDLAGLCRSLPPVTPRSKDRRNHCRIRLRLPLYLLLHANQTSPGETGLTALLEIFASTVFFLFIL